MELQLIAAGKFVLLVIAALLPIVNPLGNAPMTTQDRSHVIAGRWGG
jgi:hypothetical protein